MRVASEIINYSRYFLVYVLQLFDSVTFSDIQLAAML
jgi:hypothetical protein